MKVIMLQDVKKIGKKGETVVVSDGYGVNYLIPRGLAKASTDSSQKQLARDNAAEEARQKELKAEAEKVKAKLEGLTVEFALNVGSDGRVFGSISTKEIAEGLLKQHGIEVDKRKFIDKTPANALGYTRLKIELYKGSQGQVVGTVNVHVSEQK
ncbi:MAG: 50S ribosomal protein L9 [Bacilli bacterium]|jgi:large subunit ribosomal protein L9|nr:50S ribosomal protein L9 [Bacilli bacterium]